MIPRYEINHRCVCLMGRRLARTQRQNVLGLVLLGFSLVLVPQTVGAQDESKAEASSESSVDYLNEIKPLLREKCFSCHSSFKQ